MEIASIPVKRDAFCFPTFSCSLCRGVTFVNGSPVWSKDQRYPCSQCIRVVLHENPVCPFPGRKLHHPFKLNSVPVEILRRGVPITITSMAYGDFVSPSVQTDIQSADARFFLKMDGSCGQFRKGVARRRHDLKFNTKTRKFKEIQFPELNFTECQPQPTVPEGDVPTGFHWSHMRDVTQKVKQAGDRWYIDAEQTFTASPWFKAHHDVEKIMGEWMGPKIQGCKSDPLDVHTFIPFNMIEFVIPKEMRTVTGFRTFFTIIPNMEGMVVYCPDGYCPDRIYKIRRDMFINDSGKNMGWGRKTPAEMNIPIELQEVFDAAGARNFAEYLVKTIGLV